VRILLCVAALWWVARSVNWHDRVTLADGTTQLVRSAERTGDQWKVTLPDGAQRVLSSSDIALDDQGNPAVAPGLGNAWKLSDKRLFLLAVLVHLPVAFLLALRLRGLLSVQGIHLGYGECVKLSFAGNFLNFAAPLGSNAGDVFKAYFVSLHTERKAEAVATIAMDRVIGLATLLLIVVGITVSSPGSSRLAGLRPYMLSALIVAAVGALAYLSPFVRRGISRLAFLRRFPLMPQISRMDSAARLLVGRTREWIAAVITTIALQVLAIGAYFLVAVAVGLRAGLDNVHEFYAYFYTGAVIQALPGPPQGLGTVELAYTYFFAPFGSPSQIIFLALAARVVVLVCALPGAFITAAGAYKPNPTLNGGASEQKVRECASCD